MLTLIDTHAHLDEMEDIQLAIREAADVGLMCQENFRWANLIWLIL